MCCGRGGRGGAGVKRNWSARSHKLCRAPGNLGHGSIGASLLTHFRSACHQPSLQQHLHWTSVNILPPSLLSLSPPPHTHTGSASEGATQAKACSSQPASTNLLGRSWQVDWRCVNHAWARGDGTLARALLAYPLTLTVHRQEPSKQQQRGGQQQERGQGLALVVQGKGAAGGPTATAAAAVVPVGSVEVDLSGLLATRPGSSAPSCR